MKSIFLLLSFFWLTMCNTNKQNSKQQSNNKSIEYSEDTILSKTKNKPSIINEASTNKKNLNLSKKSDPKSSFVQDTILNNIQSKITLATSESFTQRNTLKLDELEKSLTDNIMDNNNLFNYWIAYINYYKTIVHMQNKDKEKGLITNTKSIKLLEQNKNKNSDDYALLVLAKGLSYPFASGMDSVLISKEVSNYLKDGFKLDNSNLRLYYAQGSLDFYTPKEYGGGKKVEESLLKALSLQDKNAEKTKLPTWGKEESYGLLIRFYLDNNQKEEAVKQYREVKISYPNSRIVKMYKTKLE